MKKYILSSLMLGALLLVLTGIPVRSSYAGDFFGGGNDQNYRGGDDKDHKGDKDKGHKIPEPATLALLSSGIAGVGLYGYLKRKNRK